MTERELKKLNRTELLELLLELTRRNEEAQQRITELEAQLNCRKIECEEAGSIADAAVKINGVFEAAQQAAEQYLASIRSLSEQQDAVCRKKVEDAEAEADAILAVAEIKRQKSEREAEEYWKQLSERLERFYDDHQALRELLKYSDGKMPS